MSQLEYPTTNPPIFLRKFVYLTDSIEICVVSELAQLGKNACLVIEIPAQLLKYCAAEVRTRFERVGARLGHCPLINFDIVNQPIGQCLRFVRVAAQKSRELFPDKPLSYELKRSYFTLLG
jgi:hypothetical protein